MCFERLSGHFGICHIVDTGASSANFETQVIAVEMPSSYSLRLQHAARAS